MGQSYCKNWGSCAGFGVTVSIQTQGVQTACKGKSLNEWTRQFWFISQLKRSSWFLSLPEPTVLGMHVRVSVQVYVCWAIKSTSLNSVVFCYVWTKPMGLDVHSNSAQQKCPGLENRVKPCKSRLRKHPLKVKMMFEVLIFHHPLQRTWQPQ